MSERYDLPIAILKVGQTYTLTGHPIDANGRELPMTTALLWSTVAKDSPDQPPHFTLEQAADGRICKITGVSPGEGGLYINRDGEEPELVVRVSVHDHTPKYRVGFLGELPQSDIVLPVQEPVVQGPPPAEPQADAPAAHADVAVTQPDAVPPA